MKTNFFYANLSDTLTENDSYLPLNARDMARLVALLGEDGEFTYLTVMDGLFKEYVKAELKAGIVILTRAVDSEAHKFPRGSCVLFENSLPVTKWLICNYECCTGDCEVEPVAAQGTVAPTAEVGKEWQGTVVFSGALPVQFGITGMPSWMTAKTAGGTVVLSGVPVAPGSCTVGVAASNDRGSNVAVQLVQVEITA